MKILSTTFLKNVSGTEMNQLTKETKETLDIEINNNPKKVFTNIDMWSINKKRRTFSTRRYV